MGMDKMTLKLKTATSLVVSALLGSPTAESFAPSFAIREVNMAATGTASNGVVQNIGSDRSSGSSGSSIGSSMSGAGNSISTSATGSTIISSSSSGNSVAGSSMSSSSSMSNSMSGDIATSSAASGILGALHMSREGRKRPPSPYSTRTPTTPSFGGTCSSSQPSMALNFRVDADMNIADTEPSGTSMGLYAEPLIPPEPGGISGEVEPFLELAPWVCADDRPWRKRARHARRVAALGIDCYGWEAKEGEGGRMEAEEADKAEGEVGEGMVGDTVVGSEVSRPLHGERRKRASEKTEVKASRKECASKALQRKAMPIMDLVGVTAPLFVIVGISIVQNGPGL